jgi:hypothetical protein
VAGELLVAADVVVVDVLELQRVVLADDVAARVAVVLGGRDDVATAAERGGLAAAVRVLGLNDLPTTVVPPELPPIGPILIVPLSVCVDVSEVDVVGFEVPGASWAGSVPAPMKFW